jgi:hypothetical protein
MPQETPWLGLEYHCNCIDYNALRRRLTQPDLIARARAIEQTRNSLLDPSIFRF